MRRLALLRHAKSSWDDPNAPDRDRPLAPRGRRAAPLMGAHLNAIGLAPDLVLCSPARRARETWDFVHAILSVPPDVRIEDALYGSDDEAILRLLRRTPDTAGTILVIGHNPSLEDLIGRLAGRALGAEDMPEKFPTAALAVITCAVSSWAELQPDSGRLSHFMVPRALEDRKRR